MPDSKGDSVRFGPFEFHPKHGDLRRQGRAVPLAAQPARLLSLLVDRAGRIVSREEIQRTLWPSGTFVEFDQGINHCVRQVRAALRDSADSPRYVETVPRLGYRFVAPVGNWNGDGIGSPATVEGRAEPPRRPRVAGHALAVIAIIAICTIGIAITFHGPARPGGIAGELPASPKMPVLAVLPFEYLGSDDGEAHLWDGLTEELITQLGRRYGGRMGVIAGTSATRFEGSGIPMKQFADKLGADYLFRGTVRRDGNRLRISTRLIRTRDHIHLWTANYDRNTTDWLALQEEVSRRITEALGLEILSAANRQAVASATSPAAYEEYLRGRHLMSWPGRMDIEGAIAAFQNAIHLDPGFAPAHAGMATALRRRNAPAMETFPASRRSALQALALDETVAEAHHALAMIRFYYDWDLDGARDAFRRAVELNPGYAQAWHDYAAWFSVTGDHDGALEAVRRASRLDPLSPQVSSDLGWYAYFARHYQEAIDFFRRTLEEYPRFFWGHRCIVFASLQMGDIEGAASQMQAQIRVLGVDPVEGLSRNPDDPESVMRVYWGWDMERIRHIGTRRSGERYTQLAQVHAAMGDYDTALDYLEKMVDIRSGWILPFLRVDPLFDPLRGNPRFLELLNRITPRVAIPDGRYAHAS